MTVKPSDFLAYNREQWDKQVDAENQWTQPVSPAEIEAARQGNFSIVLTPAIPVPADWFPKLEGCEVLNLAGGGGQQTPILAAAGANVTVFDNSPKQLAQDQMVADREGLSIRTVQGDMKDLSVFENESFDFIFHPCSNTFIPDVRPVWKEAYRVLKPGGDLVSGFCNPLLYIFDDELMEKGELVVRHKIPYSDLTHLSEDEFNRFREKNEPMCWGHTLDDQIGEQIKAGFAITGFFEDDWGADSDNELSKYIKSFIATKATKLRR